MRLVDMVELIRSEGFKLNRAKVKVCQEIFMGKLVQSKYKDSILFKGGTIMYQLTKEMRRSTEDVDIDFFKLSISTSNIIKVINNIGSLDLNSGIHFKVLEDKIEPLKHEAYEGKRIVLLFQDQTHSTLTLKLDIGVHTEYRIKQDNLVFDFITSDEGIKLLVNPIEQMIVEKTSSFIRFNAFSTRMKDIFDIYYLISNYPFQKHKIINIINFMFIETGQVQSLDEYQEFMINLLNNDMFKSNLKRSDNWTGIDVKDILKGLSQFLTKLTNKISF